jgi:hypothetical protein
VSIAERSFCIEDGFILVWVIYVLRSGLLLQEIFQEGDVMGEAHVEVQ